MDKHAYRFWLASTFSLSCLTTTKLCQAQITSDGTVATEIISLDNRNFTVTGGSRSGGNLFHSFREFSVQMGGSATFDNA